LNAVLNDCWLLIETMIHLGAARTGSKREIRDCGCETKCSQKGSAEGLNLSHCQCEKCGGLGSCPSRA
jgi:hypothetical protein